MSIIYNPKGKAREYSPLAASFVNLYDSEIGMNKFLAVLFLLNKEFK